MIAYLRSFRTSLLPQLKFLYSNTNKSAASGMENNNQNQQLLEEEKKGKFIVVGGGCFWCIDGVFRRVKGVINVRSGYAGGKAPNPTYKEVCTGQTGHAEVCKIFYRDESYPDKEKDTVSARDLFEIFFCVHDPTTLNYQGADHGTQYRSVVYYVDQDQKQLVEKIRDQVNASKIYPNPVVTEIAPLSANPFYEGEDYHQRYFDLNQDKNPYCQVVFPKIEKLKKNFNKFYTSNPAK